MSKGGPASDPYRLDADNDGQACRLAAVSVRIGLTPKQVRAHRPSRPKRIVFRARITDVTDGDTIKVRRRGGKRYRFRVIGIDTPETRRPGTAVECGGRVATALMFALAFTAARDTDGDELFDTRAESAAG